jgi:glycerol-3-phosphate acyltransferase PlsY
MSSSDAPLTLLVVIVLAYGLGSIPFGLLLTRAAGLGDIRKIGSGNIGATNVLRTGRKGLAAATLLLDALKGALAVLIGVALDGSVGALVCGLAAFIGHLYPVWLGFRGGKGVATFFGVLIAANPIAGLAAGAVWIGMAWWFRISSLASLTSSVAAPFLMALVTRNVTLVILALVMAALVWIRHGANIGRLMAGTEPRIGQT